MLGNEAGRKWGRHLGRAWENPAGMDETAWRLRSCVLPNACVGRLDRCHATMCNRQSSLVKSDRYGLAVIGAHLTQRVRRDLSPQLGTAWREWKEQSGTWETVRTHLAVPRMNTPKGACSASSPTTIKREPVRVES